MELLKYILFLVLIILLDSCISQPKQLKSENLSSYISLKLDGYYYLHDNEGFESFFLYNNGIYLYNGSSGAECKDLNCHETMIRRKANKNNNTNYYEYKGYWGAYSIAVDKITIKRYWGIGFSSFGVQILEGKIVNEDTIQITHFNNKKLKNKWTYMFHPYSPKPDSANNFIK